MFLWFMYGYAMIFYALFNISQTGMQTSLFSLGCFALWIPFYSIFPIMMGIMSPDIRVTDAGLSVQVFFFWWIFVPWKDILEAKPRFRKSILRKEATVVLVRRLTPFHRLIGVQIGRSNSGFQIDHSIGGYDELTSLIQRKVMQGT